MTVQNVFDEAVWMPGASVDVQWFTDCGRACVVVECSQAGGDEKVTLRMSPEEAVELGLRLREVAEVAARRGNVVESLPWER